MHAIRDVNSFFERNIYRNLSDFAVVPISWMWPSRTPQISFDFRIDDAGSALVFLLFFPFILPLIIGIVIVSVIVELIVTIALLPVTIPATIVTGTIALGLAVIAGIFHGVSLVGAGLVDGFDYCVSGLSAC